MFFLPFLISLLFTTAVGLAVGLLRALIGPAPIFGAQLKNKTVSAASYGQPWPRCRGDVRLNGNMIWSGTINDTIHKSVSGGIFGIGQQSIYTHTYSVNCAIGFGKKLQRIGAGRDPLFGSAVSFFRVYADGKILYNARVTDASGGGQLPSSIGSGQPVSSALWPEGSFSIPVTAGPNGIKLSLGDIVAFQWFADNGDPAPLGQTYEAQSPVNIPAGQAGTIPIFPGLGPDPRSPEDNHSVIFLNIPGVNGPLFAPSSFDPDPHDGSHLSGGYIPHTGGIRFYLGTDSQNPDPLMVARLGAGQTPGYRGLVYCMIYDLELSDYGNRIPNFSAEIQFDTGPVPLSEIVAALMTEAGYAPSQIDVSALALTTVQGIELDPESYQTTLHKLMALYLFDSAEIDGQIIFKFRDGLPVMEVPFEDIGALGDMASAEPRIEETLQDEQQVPETVWIRYYDSLKQFQQASQYSKRISQPYASDLLDKVAVQNSRLQTTLDAPITEIGTTIRQQADKVLNDLWSSRFHASLKLPPKYIQLDPTDIIEVPYQNDFLLIRLAQVDRGASWPLQLSGVSHDYHHSVALSDSGPGSGTQPVTPDLPPATTLILLDMPFMEDADSHNTTEDTGIYFAMATTINIGTFFDPASFQWHGGTAYRSIDNVTFDPIGHISSAAFRGTASNLLPAPTDPWVIDNSNTLTVTWTGYNALLKIGPSARPTGASDDLLTNGHANVAALIKSNGEIELLQFGNVVDHDDGTFTFSHLVRGIRGTETMAKGHATGDVFVVLTGAENHADLPLGDRGLTRYYQAISDGLPAAFTGAQSKVTIPRDLMPYAPYKIGGYIDDHDNIIVSWKRRTRLGGTWVSGIDGPLSEQFEEYQVDVYATDNTTILRTITTPLPTTIYSKDQQMADFGHLVSSISVHVYQISAIVGRGFPGIGVSPGVGVPPTWGNDPYVITFDLGDKIKPTSGQKLLEHIIAGNVTGVIFPVGMSDSEAGCRLAPTADYHITVNWQGVEVATLTYLAGQTTGSFNLFVFGGGTPLDFTVQSGELLEFIAPATEDATISGVYWTVSGKRYTQQRASIGNNFFF